MLIHASQLLYDVFMPRTTLTIEDDALSAAREYAKRRRQTLGQAVSELVRRAAQRELATEEIGGFHVVKLQPGSPKVTAAKLKELEDQICSHC